MSNKRLTPEGQILVGVRHLLQFKGWFIVRIHQGLGCHKGITDLIATKAGKTLWVEVKTPTGKLSAYQLQFRGDIERHGGTYLVIRSIEEIERYLDLRGTE